MAFFLVFVVDLHCGPMGPGHMGPGPMGPGPPQEMLSFLPKHDFNIFRRKRPFIRPPSLEPRRKMTANGLSSYQLFVKNLIFPRQKLKFPSVFDIFRK